MANFTTVLFRTIIAAGALWQLSAIACVAQRQNLVFAGLGHSWSEPCAYANSGHLEGRMEAGEGNGWRIGWANVPRSDQRIGFRTGAAWNVQYMRCGMRFSDRFMTSVYFFTGTQEVVVSWLEVPAMACWRPRPSLRLQGGLLFQAGSARSNEYGTLVTEGIGEGTEFVTDVGGRAPFVGISPLALAAGVSIGVGHRLWIDLDGTSWLGSLQYEAQRHLFTLRAGIAYNLTAKRAVSEGE